MNDLDKQIELIKLQIELAKIKKPNEDSMNNKDCHSQLQHTTPSKTLKEIMAKICENVTKTDVIKYSRDMSTVCDIFDEYYHCYDKVLIDNQNYFYVYDLNPDTKLNEWFKVSRQYLVEKILKKIDNALIKKMWISFTEEDKFWFNNDKLNHINMITSNAVLINSERDNETWSALVAKITRCL